MPYSMLHALVLCCVFTGVVSSDETIHHPLFAILLQPLDLMLMLFLCSGLLASPFCSFCCSSSVSTWNAFLV
ncbi:hypothetical protein K7X08_029814 [Anisodus acutangulus]|uniref:Secreted peptide n=1 Tax=Anisodus acutangulus TaxID=402998 RepID=A0A9Q1MC06_9SOLA|nr:hypothetical protein K7X08_029814 [Anisodus acutangulus]